MDDDLAALRAELMPYLEDDIVGFSDFLRHAAILAPSASTDEHVATARALMLELVRSGDCQVVDVPRLTWLTEDEAEVVINGDAWTRGDTHYWLSLTPAAERAGAQ